MSGPPLPPDMPATSWSHPGLWCEGYHPCGTTGQAPDTECTCRPRGRSQSAPSRASVQGKWRVPLLNNSCHEKTVFIYEFLDVSIQAAIGIQPNHRILFSCFELHVHVHDRHNITNISGCLVDALFGKWTTYFNRGNTDTIELLNIWKPYFQRTTNYDALFPNPASFTPGANFIELLSRKKLLTRKICLADFFGYQPQFRTKMYVFWLVVCFILLSKNDCLAKFSA